MYISDNAQEKVALLKQEAALGDDYFLRASFSV